MNNYERIKNMSIDEMAEVLYLLLDCEEEHCDKCFMDKNNILICQLNPKRIEIKQWLQEEV